MKQILIIDKLNLYFANVKNSLPISEGWGGAIIPL
jgi:hypothetical protein